ncbi:hypothetical protein BKA00_004911 [Actinomadura coerulea]|uniref:Lipoprotein n=1 Tax=Actinomadura coerulea TaxID=46159 RepID=A0A7X0L0Z6_9ACTN|nr:hypothetical protein [Actinomadura coerulea]MBB6397997.1 hypothetical protein [Actinomadura coerulea]GGQ32945.1 hypothetical protein GCM10010187_57400 [Actinomadura coerulea]
MRLLSIAVLGTTLVTAGLAAPTTGEALATGTGDQHGGVTFTPGTVHPGDRVELTVRGCPDAPRPRVSSAAFARRVTLHSGHGAATVGEAADPGSYKVVAHCGSHLRSGTLVVSAMRPWPSILPAALSTGSNGGQRVG